MAAMAVSAENEGGSSQKWRIRKNKLAAYQ